MTLARIGLSRSLRGISPGLFVLAVVLFAFGAWKYPAQVRIFLIGDSTMADKPVVDNPERGWGQAFPLIFGGEVVVENHARNGRSTKSFIDEGRWQTVYERLKPGDYVFIQFGHNDGKISDTTRYASPRGAYKQNLLRFVSDSRRQGAIPVLLTPVQRRKFDNAGRLEDTHGDYPGVVREVAKEQQVPLIDLTQTSSELFNRLGPEKTKRIFLWVPDGMFDSFPNGKQDNTHFTEYGAIGIAGLVADGIRNSTLPLRTLLRPFAADSLPGLNKIVALDYYYNCEWRGVGGKGTQFHYVWEDTTNSGFSELGNIVAGLGAYTTKVRQAPTSVSLSSYSVYIIVDPDTPAETERPNYIDDSAAVQIAEWVKSGGVLVLMGNDKGNSEFEHFNRLARRFGIQFNEDSHHRVVGDDYDAGKFANLPGHPMFTGVKQIYMKEICSLAIQPPAVAVLTEDGKVFVASTRFGRGMVLAVGDPWLYNEYIDSRKLPPDFENRKAGERLFGWLLRQANPSLDR